MEKLDALKKTSSLRLMTPQLLSVFLPCLSHQHASVRLEAIAVRLQGLTLYTLILLLSIVVRPSASDFQSLCLDMWAAGYKGRGSATMPRSFAGRSNMEHQGTHAQR